MHPPLVWILWQLGKTEFSILSIPWATPFPDPGRGEERKNTLRFIKTGGSNFRLDALVSVCFSGSRPDSSAR